MGFFRWNFGNFLKDKVQEWSCILFHDHVYVEVISHHTFIHILRVVFYVKGVRPLVDNGPFLASHGGISAGKARFMTEDGS